MRAKLNLLSAFAVGIVGGALVSACQTYDFEPVEPLALAQTTVETVISARSSKPNLMVLLDTSGSMKLPANPSLPDCQTSKGLCGEPATQMDCDVSKCPTRWSELQGAMSTFLKDNGATARMGLTTYPNVTGTSAAGQCGASTAVKIPIPQLDDTDTAGLQSSANGIANVIQGIPNSGAGSPVGGTPTSISLNFVGSQADLQTDERQDFILLLTDGLPNCNDKNPNSGLTNPDACQCTLSSCATPGVDRLGCLDKDISVQTVATLKDQKKIKTIVIGFGAETASGAGPATLNAMAEAGGFARNCEKEGSTCGANDTCDATTKLCGRRFYQAANQAELATALREIIELVNTNPCLLTLDPDKAPSDLSLIVVYVNDEAVAAGDNTWKLTSGGVEFQGSTCDRILASTDRNPIKVEVRAVQRK
ncbi:adventurous gliding motility lipoprotein CglB [Hyalangium versicolor]|uniref:adventurous gliding motility lipoprotein CglB n=1 Tax=Hyalangium versicolor TaxID=2861190 RepID=UPI001CCD679B|nr:adventurous gliding motility lipoprotein CglB [Hyalangium versicolor]